MNSEQTDNLTLLYSANPRRQKLASLRMTLRKVQSDKKANPLDVEIEAARIRAEIELIENPQLPPAA